MPIDPASGPVRSPPTTEPRIEPEPNKGNNRLARRVSVTAPAAPHRYTDCTNVATATVSHNAR